jgi:hypothetical protein
MESSSLSPRPKGDEFVICRGMASSLIQANFAGKSAGSICSAAADYAEKKQSNDSDGTDVGK